jgi:hypothetical protein
MEIKLFKKLPILNYPIISWTALIENIIISWKVPLNFRCSSREAAKPNWLGLIGGRWSIMGQ